MSLTKDQLLIPRVMCVGGKEGEPNDTSGDFITGDILTQTEKRFSKWKSSKLKHTVYLDTSFIEKFPHLFRPMPWWEGRKPEDMPKWVKFSENYMNFKAGSVYETECWSDKHYDCIQFRSEEGLCGVPFGKWVAPATEQEYWDSKPLRKCPDCGSEWKGNDSCPECFPI